MRYSRRKNSSNIRRDRGGVIRREELLQGAVRFLGKMHLDNGREPLHQTRVLSHLRRQGIKGLPPERAKDVSGKPSEDRRRDPFLLPVDRNNPAHMVGFPEPLLRIDGFSHRRLQDQRPGIAGVLDFPEEKRLCPSGKVLQKIFLAEPDDRQASCPVEDFRLDDRCPELRNNFFS